MVPAERDGMTQHRKMARYSVIIPAYNEEENIEPLVDDLLKTLRGYDAEVVIVDDNSGDRTREISEKLGRENKNVQVIRRKTGPRGMGHTLMEGTQKASGEYVIWVMGDRSDRLETIKDMIGVAEYGADMVIASRYMKGGSRGELDADKAFFGSTYTAIARAIFGLPVHDITNAFRLIRKNVLKDVKTESGDFAISPELAIKAHMKGYKIREVPTTYYNRRAGQTKFKLFKMGARYVSLYALKLTYNTK
jgi:dolichol-phosphate mannosyltransferase